MELWSQLFSDFVGILSAAVIGFLILMAIWFTWYFITHMMNDTKANQSDGQANDVEETHQ